MTDFPVPVTPCAPWCQYGDGHPTEQPLDRLCGSPFIDLPRSIGKAQLTDNGWIYDVIGVRAWRDQLYGDQVIVHLVEEDTDLALTPAEARTLAVQLIHHADMVEAAR